MNETALIETIKDEANRALWEVENVLRCIPDGLWPKVLGLSRPIPQGEFPQGEFGSFF
jgi:hypothetical protein